MIVPSHVASHITMNFVYAVFWNDYGNILSVIVKLHGKVYFMDNLFPGTFCDRINYHRGRNFMDGSTVL